MLLFDTTRKVIYNHVDEINSRRFISLFLQKEFFKSKKKKKSQTMNKKFPLCLFSFFLIYLFYKFECF